MDDKDIKLKTTIHYLRTIMGILYYEVSRGNIKLTGKDEEDYHAADQYLKHDVWQNSQLPLPKG